MPKLVKNVVERGYRFRLYNRSGEPTPVFVVKRAESEEAARLQLPQRDSNPYDWRLADEQPDK